MEISDDGRYFIHGFEDCRPPERFEEVLSSATVKIRKLLEDHLRNPPSGKQDHSMYTGAVGILLALYSGDPDKYEEVFRDYSVASTSPPTLLGGELSVAVLRGDLPLLRRFCLNASNLPPGDCELLYGRAGCLAGLIQ
jgi:hypothetical protein